MLWERSRWVTYVMMVRGQIGRGQRAEEKLRIMNAIGKGRETEN